MNNEQNLEQRIFAQAKNIRDDKAYFGAHLNLARHNAFIILHHINQRLGFIDQNVQDDAQFKKFKCLTILKQSSKPDLIAKSLDLIRFHFPFLQILTDKLSDIRSSNGERKILTPQEEGEIIESLLTDLNGYRNEYCHGENKSHVPDSYLIKNLKSIYDASLRMVKERFKLEPHKIKHLERNNKDGEKLNFKYALSNNSSISEKGLVFFINLFLEVKDSYSFIKKIEGFKNAGTNSLNATTYCFTIQHVRLPNPKITSQEYTKEELLLRMMNYLEKVPDQIFKTLSPADQENCKSNVDVFETPIEGDLIEKSLHKRYRDQFPEFALNYIDYYKLFPNIRFQINLGKFIFSVKDKEILGETRKRRQIQMLRGFGQIQDYQNKKNIPEIWQSLINKSHEIPEDFPDPYINDMEPHYHIENNNIYFKFMEPDTTHWPRIDARIENQNNINAHPRPRLLQADGILSVYELAPLLFYEMIRSDKSKSAETILSIQKSNIERLLNDIKSGELTKVALDKIPNPYSPSTKKFNTAKQVILKEKIEKRKIELNEKLKKYKLALDDLPKMILYYLLNIEHEDISLKVIPIIKSITVILNTQTHPANFEYLAVPKKSKHAYLKAMITNWEELNISTGPMGIYFANTFVGTTTLNPESIEDTLSISLGPDIATQLKRTKIAENTKKETFSAKKHSNIAWEIDIKNSKTRDIEVRIEDQIPLSKLNEVEVETKELSGGMLDQSTGIITWNVKIPAGKSIKKILKYQVRYPKSMKLILE